MYDKDGDHFLARPCFDDGSLLSGKQRKAVLLKCFSKARALFKLFGGNPQDKSSQVLIANVAKTVRQEMGRLPSHVWISKALTGAKSFKSSNDKVTDMGMTYKKEEEDQLRQYFDRSLELSSFEDETPKQSFQRFRRVSFGVGLGCVG